MSTNIQFLHLTDSSFRNFLFLSSTKKSAFKTRLKRIRSQTKACIMPTNTSTWTGILIKLLRPQQQHQSTHQETMKFLRAILVAILVLVLLRFEPNEACRSLHQRDEYQHQKPRHLFNILQKGSVRPPGNGCSYTPSKGGAPCIKTKNFAGHATVTPPVGHASDKEMV